MSEIKEGSTGKAACEKCQKFVIVTYSKGTVTVNGVELTNIM